VVVRRVVIVALLVALLGIILAGPAYESIDKWDNIPQTGNDTVLSLVFLATVLGAFFVLPRYAPIVFRFLCRIKAKDCAPTQPDHACRMILQATEEQSPPTTCLSPLRV
jgi:hypothetical protein